MNTVLQNKFGILVFLTGLLSLVSISANLYDNNDNFGSTTTNRHVYRSYQTSIYCNASAKIQMPNNSLQVQSIVQNALKQNQKVKAFGSLHSITDIICTQGIPISMKNINYATINEEDDTVTFGAGLELRDAMIFLENNGKSLIHVPAYGGITIGGGIGTGAHGSSLLHPTTLSDQVVSMTVVDGLGNLRNIVQQEELDAFRVHLGLLGIIIDVTFKTVPLFKMYVQNKPETYKILFDGTAANWAMEYDWFQMWWFPTYETVVVSKGNYTWNLELPGNASTNLIPNVDPLILDSSAVLFNSLQTTRSKPVFYGFEANTKFSLFKSVIGKPPIFSENDGSLKNPAVGYAWRLQSNKCQNKCAWDNDDGKSLYPEESSMGFEFSKEHFTSVMKMIQRVLKQNPVSFYFIGLFIRFSRASHSLMGMSSGRETFSIEWTFPMTKDRYHESRYGLGTTQIILQEMLEKYGGRPHWGKNGLYYHSAENIMKSRSKLNLQNFIKVMKTFDPEGIFQNKFGQRLQGFSDAMDVDPKVRHCALQDYCVCESDSDCGFLQYCTRVNGFSICKDIIPIEPLGVMFPIGY